ncbi:hypothetical protein ACDP63_16540 [Paracoccus sp. P2]|uniref:Uncharacterized protein n=1 Tax=Paracoccus pantotrophus TaxID=82367 RepID=A0A1I5JI58_PARPN|nr:hypothetical protein [Paracoccus pantotrophus]MDF3855411.1 hypothetical protein [Paracoccus pantotrophus]QFG37827.1 hypothetical protein ESD82_17230 [Paracoccus pantotrophus]QLH15374.1 hypothetical protein HYQ43_14385 [Paracoccus pantotrophus]RDD96359.1 hypothetical protein DTW92_13220 [Paracoccus pantotrophus]RKS51707.1 hypothetical protein BDE18_0968 [Paracoccus pantotrophus]
MSSLLTRLSSALALSLALGTGVAGVAGLPAPAEAQPRGKPIVIMNNRGGNVVEAIRYRNKLAASGRPVEVRGYCRSACTIYITLPNACLGPKATVGFHAPRIPGTTIIPPIVDELMAQYYRNGILRMWNTQWKHSLKMHRISAREYVRLDPQTRLCRG